MRETLILLIRTFFHIKDVHRDRICMTANYGQRWIIFTNVNHLYKKNTHLIPKNQQANKILMTQTQSLEYFITAQIQ
jgi:hypothetical protein